MLTRSKPLRLLTLFLFYFTQGFPVGVFLYAIPAWMSAGGASTSQIASVVAAVALPWSLKLVNGFIIDRYTFLPMGRRRIWIIGAQTMVAVSFVAGALLDPQPLDIAILTALAFASNAAVAMQDVSIDSLAVDIMEENERAKAAGIMIGAQLLGIAGATRAGGLLFAGLGLQQGLLLLFIIPAGIMLYGVVIRERGRERSLPWTRGESHPHNLNVKVDAWWPLLRSAFLAIVMPLSLLMLPIMMSRSIVYGAFEAFHPELFTRIAGWSTTEYTDLVSTSTLLTGITGLLLGGWLIDKVGAQRVLWIVSFCAGLLVMTMGLFPSLWTEALWLVFLVVAFDLLSFFLLASAIPLCMYLCVPTVAATQFTIYMAFGNFGRPLGSALAAWTTEAGIPEGMYLVSGCSCLVAGIAVILVRFPTSQSQLEQFAEELPQGEGMVPRID